MFTILSAKEADLNEVKAWFEAIGLTVDSLEQTLPFTMLLRINDALMGYVSYSFSDDDRCTVTDLYVSPTYRGQKFGDTLMRSLMNLLSRRGFDSLEAYTDSPFVDFMRHFGFQETDDQDLLVIPSIDAFFKAPCKGSQGSHAL